MKKTKSIIVVLLLFLSLSSAFNPQDTGLKPGKFAPVFGIKDSSQTFSLGSLKGQYVVLNFWASYDAQSRIANIRLRNAVDKMVNKNVCLVSVSYDTNRSVYEETLKLDKFNTGRQFYDEAGSTSKVFGDYRLKKGFTSYLIDPEGKIIASSLSPEKLTELISQ